MTTLVPLKNLSNMEVTTLVPQKKNPSTEGTTLSAVRLTVMKGDASGVLEKNLKIWLMYSAVVIY